MSCAFKTALSECRLQEETLLWGFHLLFPTIMNSEGVTELKVRVLACRRLDQREK